jgi:hypothetical protein
MTRARVSAETSVPPRSTFETVGTLVPAASATSASVGRVPAGRGDMQQGYNDSITCEKYRLA